MGEEVGLLTECRELNEGLSFTVPMRIKIYVSNLSDYYLVRTDLSAHAGISFLTQLKTLKENQI